MCSFSFFKILFSKQQRANDHFLFKAINKLSSIKEPTIHQKENSVYLIFFRGGWWCCFSRSLCCDMAPRSLFNKDFLSQLLRLSVPIPQGWSDPKEPPQLRPWAVVRVRVGGKHPVTNQCRSAPVQGTPMSPRHPEFPLGPAEKDTTLLPPPDRASAPSLAQVQIPRVLLCKYPHSISGAAS